MTGSVEKLSLSQRLFNIKEFNLNSERISSGQKFIFWLLVIVVIVIKILIIPYNMIDTGDNATRVWNALWWANKPFFVLPESGHPLWFYFMGPLIKITGEIYYTPIISLIILMTIAGIFIFKSTLLFTNYRTALLTFIIVTLNPVIFRLNFQPYPQQLFLTSICIMLYFLLKALFNNNSRAYFAASGIFAFTALASRPEVLFLLIPLIFYILLTRKKGAFYYALFPMAFQLFWIILSYMVYGTLFKTFEVDASYSVPLDFHGLSLGLRLKGLFLPYYFLLVGLTLILFYYFIKGIIYSYKTYPKALTILLLLLVFLPCVVNGLAGMKSTLYHSTNYIYLPFFIAPLFCAIGLNNDMNRFGQKTVKYAFAAIVILSCVPFSYVKEFVPEKYNNLFPKVIQFIVTSDEPRETRKLISFVDNNIKEYPALIFDSEENSSSIFYVPFRTKLAPPDKVLISGYNVPLDTNGLKIEIDKFIKKNPKGIIMFRKSSTTMNLIFSGLLNNKPYKRNDINLAEETDKWFIYLYGNAR
jgi:hypothetical protein